MNTAAKCFLLLSAFYISIAKSSFIPVYEASPAVIAYVPIIHEPATIIALKSQDDNNGGEDVGDDDDDGSYKPPVSAENGLWQPKPGNEGEYVEELSTTDAAAITTTPTLESLTSEITSQNSVAETTAAVTAESASTDEDVPTTEAAATAAAASSIECGPDGEDGADGADGPDGPDGSIGGKGGKGGKAGKGGCGQKGGDAGDGGDGGDAPIPPPPQSNEQPTEVVINDAINNIVVE